jgi:hypothetical protein
VEIGGLVKSLEAEYATALWDTRNMFVQASKPSITRVKHKHFEKAVSKLSQEIHPEDVIESTVKNWTDMDDDDYDGDYIASTDPIHPVSTEYSHPSDDEDGDWIRQHLPPQSPEYRADTHLHPDLDFHNNSGWNWTVDSSGSDAGSEMNKDQAENSSSDKYEKVVQQARGLVAWGPDIADSPSSIGILHLTGETERETRVKQVIEAFWSVVNCVPLLTDQQSPRSPTTVITNTPDHLLHDLNIVDSSPTLRPYGTITKPPPSSASTPPSPNSTQMQLDQHRKFL